MTPLETASAPEREYIERRVEEDMAVTAERAKSVGEYRKLLGELAPTTSAEGEIIPDAPMGNDGATEAVNEITSAERQAYAEVFAAKKKESEKALKGAEGLAIDQAKAGTNVLGDAVVGGGEGTIRLNPDLVAGAAAGKEGQEKLTDTIAHEKSHATEQEPMGTLYTNTVVTSFDQLEDKSERAGAKATGKRRSGQPAEYRKAQEKSATIRDMGVKVEEADEKIAKGDTEGLQRLILERGLDTGKLTEEKIIAQAEKSRDAMYQTVAGQVLMQRYVEKAKNEQVLAMAA